MPQNQATFIIQGQKLRMVDGVLSGPEELVADLMKAHEWLVETGKFGMLSRCMYNDVVERYGDLSYWRYIGAMLQTVYKDEQELSLDENEPILEDGVDIRKIKYDPNAIY